MNEPVHEMDDKTLDLLVDGELPDEERRRILTGLDGTTDGWRRCALAFLEAQAWRSHLPSIVRQGDLRPQRVVAAEVVEVRTRRADPAWRVWRPRLALAASFLLAFSLGLALRSAWLVEEVAGPSSLATSGGSAESQFASVSPGDEASAGQVHRLRLRMAGTNEPAEVEWPMYDPATAPRGVLSSESAMPESLIRELEQQGHQVNQFRDWVPVQLDDGRQGLVPVDRVDVQVRDLDEYQ